LAGFLPAFDEPPNTLADYLKSKVVYRHVYKPGKHQMRYTQGIDTFERFESANAAPIVPEHVCLPKYHSFTSTDMLIYL
jgi:hypothetical protein